MRVLHLNDRLSNRGGADIHLLGILDAQATEPVRHDAHLAVGRVDRTAATTAPVHEVAGLDAREHVDVPALARLLDDVQPDLVHVHNVMNPAVFEALRGVATVMTVQDHRTFCPGRGKLTLGGEVCTRAFDRDTCATCFEDDDYLDSIFALTRARADAIRDLPLIVLSEYMRKELETVGATQVEVIPPFVYGLDPDSGTRTAEDPCVLFVGRLVAAKGVRHAVDAWEASGVDLPLVLAGTGPVKPTRPGRSIHYAGWTDRAALSGLYRRAQVVLMPSLWQEPFGIVGLEALRFGVPVAAYDSGGIREWHPGDGLVPWGDVGALAAAIQRLAGAKAGPPTGFERNALMARLDELYQKTWKTWSSTRTS